MPNNVDQHVPAWLTRYRRERRLRRVSWAALWFIVGVVMSWLVGGCATWGTPLPVEARAGEEQVVHIIWAEVYARTDRPPMVRWIQGAALSCTDPNSGTPGFPVIDLEPSPSGEGVSRCRNGFTWSPLEVLVAWHGEPSFSETTLAHELLHALLLREGVFTDHHGRPDFYPRVDAANEAVRQAGR